MFLKERQTACKPGSVPPRGAGPRAEMAIPLGRPLPGASCDRPERRREGPPGIPAKGCLPLLLGLAPGGVFPAAAVAGGAVRSYRTVSPLPAARFPETDRRCTFCGTFPGVAPAGRYPAPYLRGARTFLPPPSGGERPSGRLALEIWEFATRLSKPEGTRMHAVAWDFMGCTTSATRGRDCAAKVRFYNRCKPSQDRREGGTPWR